ncbi:DUF5667 domain-containing protein [Scopulibacillus cellulosilyticus]|uniref:DUF5667 domain-containing protein n=1 Tax=Scopulibacillus cellulosilyticus TaxID=2665665 RepID=A0ABW2PQT6_9BACL
MNRLGRTIITLSFTGGLAFSLLIPAGVSAKADTGLILPEIIHLGVTPENQWLYDLDNDLDSLRMGLTINENKKLSVIASMAEGKLSDLKKLMEMYRHNQLSDQSYSTYVKKVVSDYKSCLNKTYDQLLQEAPNHEVREKLINVIQHFTQIAEITSNEIIDYPADMSKIKDAELAVKVLSDYNKDVISQLQEEGLDVKDMAYVFVLSEISGQSPEKIADLKLNNEMTYKEIAKSLGVNPSKLSFLKNKEIKPAS